jgi:hypothetical protein
VHLLLNDSTYTFDQLDTSVQSLFINFVKVIKATDILRLIQTNPKANFKKFSQQNYDSILNSYQNKHLLTLGVTDTTYSDGFFLKNVIFSTESVKGFLPTDRSVNLQWDVKASYMLNDDTLKTGRNLNRQILTIEPGINLVAINKSSKKSWLEFKLSSCYNHIYAGIYNNESRDNTTINGTLRIRITNDIWIPFQIKYDPKNGNVFGFLNVTSNFTGLKSLIMGKSS